jgi:uncharacterized protein (DUF2235 family)
MNLCKQLNNEINEEKIDFNKINEAVSDAEKLKLLKGEFKNVLGSHFVDKASDEDILKMSKLVSKRDAIWSKQQKDTHELHKEIDAIHRKYREDNGPCY